MTEDELFDSLSELEETVPQAEKPARFEAAAAALEVGERGRASFLMAAGEHWQMAGAYDDARRCYAEALADGGHSEVHPVAGLLDVALDESDDAATAEHLTQLRELAKQDGLTAATCHYIGECLEEHDQLRAAHRWFTMPLTWADDADDLDDLCLVGRFRVRQALGLPRDRFDAIALQGHPAMAD